MNPSTYAVYLTGTRIDPFTRKDDERLGPIPIRSYSQGKSLTLPCPKRWLT